MSINRFLHKTDTLFLDARGEAIIFAFVMKNEE